MRTAWFGTLLLIAAPLAAGPVYRSVDEAGNVSYSDRPQGADAQPVQIVLRDVTPAPQPEPAGQQRPAPDAGAAAGGDEQTDAEPGEREDDEPTPEEAAAERAANCATATQRLERYLTSRRLYRSLPNGEREYLSDAEIDQARAAAASDVGEWCD